jgi:hypothetical protein
MVLKDILAISGQSGLYKFIAQAKNAIIIEHLETRKRSSAFGSAKVSSLEEISVFTENEDMSLGKVFDLIYEKENGGAAIDYRSDPDKLKTYFGEIVPEYDRERVYNSDIRKIIHWYNILHTQNLLVPDAPEEPEKEKAKESEPVKKSKPEEKDTQVIETVKKKEPAAGKKKSPGEKKAPAKKEPTGPGKAE